MVKKKRASGRKTLKDKYKIEKKVREHKRKERKKQRARLMKGGPLKPKGDPGIPNSHPYKEQLLQQIEVARERLEKENERQKGLRRDLFLKRRGLGANAPAGSLRGLVKQANAAGAAFEAAAGASAEAGAAARGTDNNGLGDSSRRAYMRELRKVIDQADVILQVLDARDPMGCRAMSVEQSILAHPDKKLVLVLNKVDLVPTEVAEGWLAYLRQSHPTVAFKASTQEQRRLNQIAGDALKLPSEALSRSGAVGADMLLQLLKNYSRSRGIKTVIAVGVIGYPNVGKSSIINSLKRQRKAGVSPVAGFTKVVQEVQLDKKIRLLDSPGVVFDDSDEGSVLMRNCVNAQTVPDPVGAVGAILTRCEAEQLMQLYCIARFDDLESFLALVARKRGKLNRGGVPDKVAAARTVLQDWNAGRVPFFTQPPALANTTMADPVIVETFGMDEVMDTETRSLQKITRRHGNFVAFASSGPAAGPSFAEESSEEEEEEDEEEEMEVEAPAPAPRRSSRRTSSAAAASDSYSFTEDF